MEKREEDGSHLKLVPCRGPKADRNLDRRCWVLHRQCLVWRGLEGKKDKVEMRQG
jgi:hypothetical protein